ncbi:hypothetical protein B0H13DRAFT_2289556 [Mycena leptocephala]|nr:hypothetical protein B0H13DRAFT_2289556 [Mycena leptocephala]
MSSMCTPASEDLPRPSTLRFSGHALMLKREPTGERPEPALHEERWPGPVEGECGIDDVVYFPYNIPHQAMAILLKSAGDLRPDIQATATARACQRGERAVEVGDVVKLTFVGVELCVKLGWRCLSDEMST